MKKRKLKTIKSYVKFLLAICVIVACVSFYIVNILSPLKHPTTIVINRGMSVSYLSQSLYNRKIISSKMLFEFFIKLNGGKIMAGEYDIPANTGCLSIATMVARGDIATTNVTIPEGYTIKQTKKMLESIPTLNGDVNCNTDKPVCNLHDGDIFPDTYKVARGTNRLAVLELAYKKMQTVKNKFLSANYPYPLKDFNDVLTLASIVQKETPSVREMPIVAGVYLNRLRIKMRLQADPTVVYVLTDGYGDMHGQPLLSGHLKIQSPYNTYTNYGLPPKPIANVGMSAIRAVLHPAKTKYLYFVADGRGGHLFSVDYADHQKKHNVWRQIKNKRQK
ncbi:MAG: endolytic transglycosylase MltG [Alphaproteobacteria bacterium]|nr:endolytic transglycosylase MltG [Alphaproteobacteria bacterium]